MSESCQRSVILCHCQGEISKKLSLSEIGQFLCRMAPNVSVGVTSNLCQAGTFAQLIHKRNVLFIVGACSELRRKYHFVPRINSGVVSPYLVSIVDVLKASAAPYSSLEATERVKLLLWAQLSRMSQFTGLRQDKLKLQLAKPQGKFSRRELFSLFQPYYQVVPYIDSTRCPGSETCHLCQDTCPLQAIMTASGKTIIDQSLCGGCGGCVMACPQRAIVYPTFSLEQLDKEMEGLLLAESTQIEPRIIALTCQRCLAAPDGDEAQLNYPSNILPLSLPCLAMASPWLILRAFDLGAQGVVLISTKGKCPLRFDSTRWQGTLRFVQALLNCWSIEPQRLKALAAKEPEELEQGLAEFAQEVAPLPPTLLTLCQPTDVPANGLLLPALIKGIGEKLTLSSTGVISAGIVPFGKVEMTAAQCTGCGLCAVNCPTQALALSPSEEADNYRLLFCHDLCLACSACLKACPEHCLRLETLLELDRLGKPPALLFQDSLVRCRQCGSPIGPQAMINRLRTKVPEIGSSIPSQFEFCSICQVKAELTSK